MKLFTNVLILLLPIAANAQRADPLCQQGLVAPFGLGFAACCPVTCGTCGGPGCDRRPGGARNCCGSIIFPRNRDCSMIGPPCTIPRDPQCVTGIRSNDADNLCCSRICGGCGAAQDAGCGNRSPIGDSSDQCCSRNILNAGESCNDRTGPCIMARTTRTPPTGGGDPTCARGILSRGVCCAASCGQCGGFGCRNRPGGRDGCCRRRIRRSGRTCSNNEAPCVI